jgi:hypothetical protein
MQPFLARCAAVVFLGPLVIVACHQPPTASKVVCLEYAAPAIAASVREAATGTLAIGALVTATEGTYLDSARVRAVASDVGLAYERPGTYAVTASKEGYAIARAAGVRVTADQCHVLTVHVTFDLKPLQGPP